MNKNNTQPIRYYAFYDVDETIIGTKSMFSFLKFCFEYGGSYSRAIGQIRFWCVYYKFKFYAKLGKSREFINREYYKLYRGMRQETVNSLGNKWFLSNSSCKGFFNEKVIETIKKHKIQGAKIVLVSGSFCACLTPIAKYVEADQVLSTNLKVIDGIYTGEIIGQPIIGSGKSTAVKEFLSKERFSDYKECFAYADHISDTDMLNLFGHPVVVARDSKLNQYGKERGWDILS
jgi:HAD superfamily hydrolase (TIGR01490 family)